MKPIRIAAAITALVAGLLAGCDPAYTVFMEVNLPQTSSLTVAGVGEADRRQMFQVITDVARKHGLEKRKADPGSVYVLFDKSYKHQVSHFHVTVEEIEGLGRWQVTATDFLTTSQTPTSRKVVTDLIQGLEKKFGRGVVTLRYHHEFP